MEISNDFSEQESSFKVKQKSYCPRVNMQSNPLYVGNYFVFN